MWRIPALVLLTLASGVDVYQTFFKAIPGSADGLVVTHFVLCLIQSLMLKVIGVIGVMGKPIDDAGRVLWMKKLLCGLVALWAIIATASCLFTYFTNLMFEWEGSPAGVYVQPSIYVAVVFTAACVLAWAVWRARDNRPGAFVWWAWVSAAVLVAGQTLLNEGQLSRDDLIGSFIWVSGALMFVATPLVFMRPWAVRG